MACGRGHLRDHRAALLPGDASCTLCGVRMQRLEPFVALLLIRQRPTHTAGGGQHWALGAAVTSLPSGVLAMVCEAMMKLESKLDVRPARLLRLCAGCCSVGLLTRQAACGRRGTPRIHSVRRTESECLLRRCQCVRVGDCAFAQHVRTWPFDVCVCPRCPRYAMVLRCATRCSLIAPP